MHSPDANFQCNARAESPEPGDGILPVRLYAVPFHCGPQENVGDVAGPQAE